ncbi:MAG: Holliday junction branch migration protein RuvA [Bowdeniella nasicola]|nr:Holliday junction branch migration protein RuvA [Bowdeniella nasicola]
MIDHLCGEVTHVGLDYCVLEAGGVGYRIDATPQLLSTLREGARASVVTEFVVRQDAMLLYGFATTDERRCFQLLQTVSGIGARTALSVLAVHSPDELRLAVANEDLKALQRVPGIGKKSASRIALELKDKIGPPPTLSVTTPVQAIDENVLAALIGLGWNEKQAYAAIEAVTDTEATTPEILRAALRHLGKK